MEIKGKGKGEGALDALAIAALPLHAQVSYLAAKIVRELPKRRGFALDDARAVVRSLFPRHGELESMSNLLLEEVNRQKLIYNGRQALKLAEKLRNRPIGERLNTPEKRKQARLAFAAGEFGDYVRNTFADDVIALLELLKHDHRIYSVDWLDAGVRPAISALVMVTITGEEKAFEEGFLLYKVPGTGEIKVAEVGPGIGTIRDAWAYQVPKKFVILAKHGWRFTTDFANQTLVATFEGETRVIPWQGSADHEDEG